MRTAAAGAGWMCWVLPLIAVGCAQNPLTVQQQADATRQTAMLAQKNQELQSKATALDQDNVDLQTQLAQSQKQSRLYQDQILVLREQLSSTTAQLAQTKQDKDLVEHNAQTMMASTRRHTGATITPNNSLRQNLPALNIPGVEIRQDGDVVRIELAADRIFYPGTAQVRPDAHAVLDAVTAEIERTYPEQMIGVEGHTDNNAPPPPFTTPQLYSSNQAMAVLDHLTAHSHLRPSQLFLVGHGGNHPVVSNATAQGQARNRRVELVIYPDRISQ